MLALYGDVAVFVGGPEDYSDGWRALRRGETTRRPLGSADRVAGIDAQTGRRLARQKRGPNLRGSGWGARTLVNCLRNFIKGPKRHDKTMT